MIICRLFCTYSLGKRLRALTKSTKIQTPALNQLCFCESTLNCRVEKKVENFIGRNKNINYDNNFRIKILFVTFIAIAT